MSEKLSFDETTVLFNKFSASQLRSLISGDSEIVLKSKPTQKWQEKDGIITFSVTSDGTTGEEWTARLEGNKFKVGKYAKQLIASKDFKPTNGTVYNVSILKGELFTDDKRITKNIRSEAERRNLQKPNPEVACLIRVYLADDDIKDMGLWWLVVMHEPINDVGGGPGLLYVDRSDGGGWLGAGYGDPGSRWSREDGFVFASAQISS